MKADYNFPPDWYKRLNKRHAYQRMLEEHSKGRKFVVTLGQRINFQKFYNALVDKVPVNEDINFWIEELKKDTFLDIRLCLCKKCEDCCLKEVFLEFCEEKDYKNETYCSFVGSYILNMEMIIDPEVYYDIEVTPKRKLMRLKKLLIKHLEDNK